MLQIKVFFTSTFILLAIGFCSAQTNTADCSKDSLVYKSLFDIMYKQDFDTLFMQNVSRLAFDRYKNRDCFCDLLIYARMFDYLLQNGLDINYSYLKNPPIRNSTNWSPDSEAVKEINRNNRKAKLFLDFLRLKKTFESDVIVEKYENDKKRSLVKDVSGILIYNIYGRPNDLKNILLSKNAQSLEDKYIKEVEVFMGKD